jgi:hypothetical protein
MSRHWKVGMFVALIALLGIALGMVVTPIVGVVALMVGVVILFVLSIAGMWPRGYEEHDEKGNTEARPR